MKTTNVKNYYSALQEQFRLQSEVLTDVLPHSGERGRNNEERFREFLSRILPKRFSVGSGFVICSEPGVPVSSQTDVVLFDEFWNSPIHRELSSHVYPVEMVYGTVEVKGRLKKGDLAKICKDIAKGQRLGLHKYYLHYGSKQKSESQPEALVVAKQEYRAKLFTRSFVFAYEQRSWKTLSEFVEDMEEAVTEAGAHIHGLAVLDKDWFISQEPHPKEEQRFESSEGDALLKFVSGMLHCIGSVKMMPMSIDRYYQGGGA